jgi:hypothetical protein
MNTLTRYDQARYALAECQRVDEVKDIRDKAEAMAAYARQAKDTELVQWATEIKVRAERKAGELLKKSADSGERFPAGGLRSKQVESHGATRPSTLDEIGISNTQSSRWQSLAGMSDEHFETAVATAKETAGHVTTAFMLREASRNKPQGKAQTGPKAEAIREELKAAKERGVSLLETYARLTLQAVRSQDSFTEQERLLLAELLDVIAAATAETVVKQ